jgi:hypothetical protein
MRSRKYIIYTLILVLLAGYYVYFEIYLGNKKARQNEDAKNLFSIQSKDIDQIKVIRKDEGESILIREGSEWSITKPVQAKADKTEVEELLSQIERMRRERVAAENANDLSQFGLKEPRLKLMFRKASTWSEIDFGDTNPLNNEVYARPADGKSVFLIAEGAFKLVDKPLFNLRDRRIFTVQSDQVDGVDISKEQFQAHLERPKEDKNRSWRVVGNQGFRLKKDKVEEFIRNLTWLRVSAFEDETDKNLPNYGLDKPVATVTLKQGETVQTMIFGACKSNGEGVYAKLVGKPGVVMVEGRSLNDVPGELRELEDRSLYSFEEDQIYRVLWKVDKGEYEAKREKDEWIITLPDSLKNKKIEPWKVNYVLWKLKNMEYSSDEFKESDIAGRQTDWSVSIFGLKDKPVGTLAHFSRQNPGDQTMEGLVKARIPEKEKICRIDDETLNEIDRKLKELGEIEK